MREPGGGPTRRTALLLAGAAALSVAAGCAPAPAAASRLRIACGERGGTYIRFGALLAAAAERAGITGAASAIATGGSGDNVALVATGGAELGMSLADTAASAPGHIRALGRVYQNSLQCFVRADSPITAAEALRGATISIGAPGSGTATTSRRVLDALGIDAEGDGIRLVPLADAVAGLGDGRIDAVMWSGGIPAPEVAGLAERVPVRLLDLSSALPVLDREHRGVYQRTTVPAEVYALDADVATIGVSNLLLCRRDLDPDAAARLVDVLVDDARRLVPDPSAGVQYLTSSELIDTAPVELHPAAAERYAERHG